MQSMRQSVTASVSLGEANSERLKLLVQKMEDIERIARQSEASTKGERTPLGPEVAPVKLARRNIPQMISRGPDKNVSWRMAPIKSSDCNSWCSCRCHSRRTFKTPCTLTSVLLRRFRVHHHWSDVRRIQLSQVTG